MTNVLKIALTKDEEKIACIITAYYEVALEEEMIIRALANSNYEWLMFVFGFDKNYIGPRHKKDAPAIPIKYVHLFDMILRHYGLKQYPLAIEKIQVVCDWKIVSTDNILIALLEHHIDEVAIKFMGYYNHFMDKELFIFCMTHGNNLFLQRALLLSAFDKLIFREEQVINEILHILKEGYRTNFLMNILALIDISVWKNKHLKDLIDIINDYVEQDYDKNRLLLSPNVIMTIALAAEILINISRARKKFDN